MKDPIERQEVMDAIYKCTDIYVNNLPIMIYKAELYKAISELPSAEPERLTDDDFETIRIHLNAYKEKLCNQHRWKEAEEYQSIIDRFMAFASTQSEVVKCEDCKYRYLDVSVWKCPYGDFYCACGGEVRRNPDDFCSRAERRNDG